MVVRYPEPQCDSSPTGGHYITPLVGNIWRCKYCWVTKWQPESWNEAVLFSDNIQKYGLARAYQIHIGRRPRTKELLAKLEKIRLLRKVLPEDELMIAIAAIAGKPALQETIPPEESLVEGSSS